MAVTGSSRVLFIPAAHMTTLLDLAVDDPNTQADPTDKTTVKESFAARWLSHWSSNWSRHTGTLFLVQITCLSTFLPGSEHVGIDTIFVRFGWVHIQCALEVLGRTCPVPE